MSLLLRESQDIDELAGVLYYMLPGSGNPRFCFPIAAKRLGVDGYWIGGSKRPAIVTLLSETFERERHKFCGLIEGVVRDSLSWRAGKDTPLTRDGRGHQQDRPQAGVQNTGPARSRLPLGP